MTKQTVEYFMRQAILEGRKALPHCRPNPPVGSVIVKNGEIIARGHTNAPGRDHAEAMALKQVPEDVADLELFVTLEPCTHYGLTAKINPTREMTEEKVDEYVAAAKIKYPDAGRTWIGSTIKIMFNVHIAQRKIAKSLQRVDPEGTALRWAAKLNRREYSVPHPHHLWHHDCNHKVCINLYKSVF